MLMRVRDEDVEELRQLEESLWRSETRFDREYMDRVLAHDFVEFGRSSRIYQRQDTLAVPWQETMANLPLKNFDAHFIDTNVVLVTYVSEVM